MSQFDCDLCGDQGMCEYTVTLIDMTTAELCSDCLEREERAGQVLLSKRFLGVK